LTPVNPSFGGPVYNGQWLLASANAQNKYADQQQPTSTAGDLIQDFKTNMQRQILSRLADRVVSKAFGEEGLEGGFYDLGDFTVDVGTDVSGINVVLIDKANGSQTTIQIPYY